MNWTKLTKARQSVIQAVAESFDRADGNEDRLIALARARLEGDPLIASLSWRDVYSVMLDRLPDPEATRFFEFAARYSAPAHICDILRSEEFSAASPSFILNALPDKEPIFFVHIPKTAGTTLKDALRAQAACLPWDSMYEERYWLCAAYGDMGQYRFLTSHWRNPAAPLWMTGHYPLRKVIDERRFRSGHRGFTIFRRPIDIIVSQLNYMATGLRREPERRDVVAWRAHIKKVCPEFDERDPKIDAWIADKILRAEFFRRDYGNIMSNFLGDAGLSLASVIRHIRATGLDIVQIEDLSGYVLENFGLSLPEERSNVSEKVISTDGLLLETMIYMRETLMAKDIILYDWAASLRK